MFHCFSIFGPDLSMSEHCHDKNMNETNVDNINLRKISDTKQKPLFVYQILLSEEKFLEEQAGRKVIPTQ